MRIASLGAIVGLTLLGGVSPSAAQYQIEFFNHSDRDVDITVVWQNPDWGPGAMNARDGVTAGNRRVPANGRWVSPEIRPWAMNYWIHVTPVDGLTATKTIEVRGVGCCSDVPRYLTYAVDEGDFPSVDTIDVDAGGRARGEEGDPGGGGRSANHPFLGTWTCGPGTMEIRGDGSGTIAGERDQGWGAAYRNGGTISGLQASDGTATMNVAYGDGTGGTFRFQDLAPNGQAFRVVWAWERADDTTQEGAFSCRRPPDP